MEAESPTVPRSPARTDLVPKFWKNDIKGLHKELISFRFMSMTKPTPEARCHVSISEVNNLSGKESNILNDHEPISEQWITIGSGLTPIDCYIELFLIEMLPNEKSKCTIRCKDNLQVSFILKLLRVETSKLHFTKSPKEILVLAKTYKENGVKMFSKYPVFAHSYFNRAAKCLLSCAPLEGLDPAQEGEETITEMQTLLETLYLNISACLIKEHRYDEVLQILQFIALQEKPSEKAIYRMAVAQFQVKQYPEAIKTLERINYATTRDCAALYQQIKTTWQQEQNQYNNMVKKMFG